MVEPGYKAVARAELPADTVALARSLVGKIVVRETPQATLSGRIVETDEYPPGDAAGHGFRGETASNRVLFLERGHAHVYIAYGVSRMLNVSAEAAGVGAGVLIRALEPLEGIEVDAAKSGTQVLRDLARGCRGVSRRPCRSTSAWTASTSAAKGRCGSHRVAARRRRSASAPGSASPRRPSARYASTPEAAASSAARRRSIADWSYRVLGSAGRGVDRQLRGEGADIGWPSFPASHIGSQVLIFVQNA